MTDLERLAFLREARTVLDDQIREVRAKIEGKQRRRSRNDIPACGSETAYQRHIYRRRAYDEPFPEGCGCRAAHAEHERLRKGA